MRGSRVISRGRTLGVVAVMAVLAATGVAGAATSTKPAVVTRAATTVTPQSALLVGSVDPNRADTKYRFRVGRTTAYTYFSPVTDVGRGTRAVRVTAVLTLLQPNTTYHYRLYARNSHGLVRGKDRTFKTRKVPLGLSFAASPNPVVFGRPTTLLGFLTGTGAAGRPVALEANPFPYTGGFKRATNPQVVNAAGAFSFPLLSVPLTTQYRVVTTTKPLITSPVVLVAVAARVSTRLSTRHVRRGHIVRFSGTLRPALVGALVRIQRQKGSHWVTLGRTISVHGGATFARYAKRIHVRRGGNYRVQAVVVSGNYVTGVGRTMRIHTRP